MGRSEMAAEPQDNYEALERTLTGFFQDSSLYKRVRIARHSTGGLPEPSLNGHCGKCRQERTFKMAKAWGEIFGIESGHAVGPSQKWPTSGVVQVSFACSACKWQRHFLVAFESAKTPARPDPGGGAWSWIDTLLYKVGEWPRATLHVEPELKKAFPETYFALFARGRECENEGFAIAAAAYYRRIVETLVDEEAKKKAERLDAEGAAFLAQVADAHHMSDRIHLVADELPREYTSENGINLLARLYGELSACVHYKPEAECAEALPRLRKAIEDLFLDRYHRSAAKARAKGLCDFLKKPAN
jgi:hypothetical protein